MKIKKVLIEVNKGFSPHHYMYAMGRTPDKETDCYFRANVFYGGGRYFFFYSGLFKKRRLKRSTWLLELILNLEKEKAGRGRGYVMNPHLRILEGVEREEGRYKYEKIYVSAYLMRRLLEGSTRPDTIKELEVYES